MVALRTDFVFSFDAAMNTSLALANAMRRALAALITGSGLRQGRAAFAEEQAQD